MAEPTFPAQPTAGSLKKELKESLEVLIKDFDGLKNFVAEITPDGISASNTLSKEDVHDLLSATLEIRKTRPQTI